MALTMMLLLVDGLIGVLKRSGEASRFVTLMELTGLTHQLQRMHEFTIFLPSNDAIQVSHFFYLSTLMSRPVATGVVGSFGV